MCMELPLTQWEGEAKPLPYLRKLITDMQPTRKYFKPSSPFIVIKGMKKPPFTMLKNFKRFYRRLQRTEGFRVHAKK